MPLKSIAKSIAYRGERIARKTNQTAHRLMHRTHLPKMDAGQSMIVEQLRTEGAYVSSIDELATAGLPNTNACFEALKSVSNLIKIDDRIADDEIATVIYGEQLNKYPEILKWGLNEPLLTIMENYIGLPPVFRGADVRCNFANGIQTASRYWHIDSLDTRIVSVIIYLRDVGTNDGPFTYIPLNASKDLQFEMFNGNRVTDDDVTKKVPKELQIECTGPAGTVVIVDNCSVWHRGKTGSENDRYASFYVYHSAFPLRPEVAVANYSREAIVERYPDLTVLQKRALSGFQI